MSLYQDARPKTLKGMVGNKATKKLLISMVEDENRQRTYLFYGPVGCGKTTAARAFTREIGAEMRENNTGENRGIDMVRGISEELQYSPLQDVVWIMDEAHGMTPDAVTSFLKVSEDAPNWAYFILCSTQPEKIDVGIKSRFTECSFKPITQKGMTILINRIVTKHKLDVSEDVVSALIEASDGSPRKAIVLLEELSHMDTDKECFLHIKNAALNGEIDNKQVIELLRLLISVHGSWKDMLSVLKSLQKQRLDPEKLRRSVIGYMNVAFLNEYDKRKAQSLYDRMKPFIDPATMHSGFPAFCHQCYRASIGGGEIF